jgi:hypothetical protein
MAVELFVTTPIKEIDSIRYTLDGTTPNRNATPYSSPIELETSATIHARVLYVDHTVGPLSTATYSVTARTPGVKFIPPSGVAQPTSVSLSCPGYPDAEIWYTTNGATPVQGQTGNLYSSPISVNTNTTIKAVAYQEGLRHSVVKQATYTAASYGQPTLTSVSFNPASGATLTYPPAVGLSVVGHPNATILYSLDGSTPNYSSHLYEGVPVTLSTTTIKAFAVEAGYNDSAVTTATYTFAAQPPQIQTQPQSQTCNEGDSYSFSVTAIGENLTYRWYKNGVQIPGATTSTYSGEAAIEDDSSVFYVIVSNSYGVAASENAVLTVVHVDPNLNLSNGLTAWWDSYTVNRVTGTQDNLHYTNGLGQFVMASGTIGTSGAGCLSLPVNSSTKVRIRYGGSNSGQLSYICTFSSGTVTFSGEIDNVEVVNWGAASISSAFWTLKADNTGLYWYIDGTLADDLHSSSQGNFSANYVEVIGVWEGPVITHGRALNDTEITALAGGINYDDI